MRRRYEEPLVVKVRRQLLSIAELPLKPVEDEVVSIARTVCDNSDDEELRNDFYSLTLQLVIEQPFKIPFVAAVVLVMNTIRQDLVGEILTRAAALTNEAIAKGEWREVKLLLKFLGSLQGLLTGEGVFPVLEDILAKAVDLQTENNEEVSKPRGTTRLSTTNLCQPECWARAGQDHSLYHPLHHGFLVNGFPAEGCEYGPKHGYHCW
jgi:nuclear cap-binding protein subunit 1